MAERPQLQPHLKFFIDGSVSCTSQRSLHAFSAPATLSPLLPPLESKNGTAKAVPPLRYLISDRCYRIAPLSSYSNESTHPQSAPQSPARRRSSSPKSSSS